MDDPFYMFDVLNEKTDFNTLLQWILGDIDECSVSGLKRSDFALYFLNYLQEQTSSIIETCSNVKKDDSDRIEAQEEKSTSNKSNDSIPQKSATSRYARKIFSSPSDKSASLSIKRMTPQPCSPVPVQYNRLRNTTQSSEYQSVPKVNSATVPMIYYPHLGYNVPYYGNQNYNSMQINQFNCPPTNVSPVSPNNLINFGVNSQNYNHNLQLNRFACPPTVVSPVCTNPVSGGSNFQNVCNPSSYNFAFPLSPQLCTASNVRIPSNFPGSPQKSEQGTSQKTYDSFNQQNSDGFQTPKTPKVNSSTDLKRTPNSSSSCSSGVSLLSPESPSYSENFPPMASGNERKSRHDYNNSDSLNNNNSTRHIHSKKRIKPTLLIKTPENSPARGVEFGKELKTSTSVSAKAHDTFPERKQNFFEDEKFLSDKEKLNIKVKKNNDINSDADQIRIMKKPIKDSENCDILDETIHKVNGASLLHNQSSQSSEKKTEIKLPAKNVCTKRDKETVPDPSKVKYKEYLNKLADVYCAVLDANLVPNITAEIYFVFSLLTVTKSVVNDLGLQNSGDTGSSSMKGVSNNGGLNASQPVKLSGLESKDVVHVDSIEMDKLAERLNINDNCRGEANPDLQLFCEVHQSVYFACRVLSAQKHVLEILDKATLKALFENKRLLAFVPEVVDYLTDLYTKKNKESRNSNQVSLIGEKIDINPVPFQMEIDNRDTFSAESGFHAFRKQRDSLYDILQIWNEVHEKPNWNFSQLALKVERLFTMSTDPVNMRHLARHFCDLLLKSVNSANTEAEEYSVSGMPEIDKSKLSRLTERLIRPSPSSGEKDPRPSPDFPGLQTFYRDFLIVPSAHYSFHTHVINCLTERIHLLNYTSFQFEEPDPDNGQMVQGETRCAFLQCLRSLCVLAKFLGLVVFHPYQSSSELPQSVLQDEIVTRNKVLPPLDLNHYLVVAQAEGRLVQTVPWIVEYLGMMDSAAPHLVYYQTVLNTLFALYLSTAPHSVNSLPSIRQLNNFLSGSLELHNGDNTDSKLSDPVNRKTCKLSKQTAILLRFTIGWLFDTSNFSQSLFFSMASSYKEDQSHTKDVPENKWFSITVDSSDIIDEKLLQEFCPYLINLRLSLGKSTRNKQGPVRHITPVPTQSPISSSETMAFSTLELQLEENFFMGQSESLRRTVDFVAERVASACIKNICSNVIVSLKRQVCHLKTDDEKAKKLQPFIEKYYQNVEAEINKGIDQRLNIALSALLGPDVADRSVNKSCQQIAARKLKERVVNWLQSHINISEILTKGQTNGISQHVINYSSQNRNKNSDSDSLSPSEALIILQVLLTDIFESRGIEGVKSSTEIIHLFNKLKSTIYVLGDNSLNIKLILSLVLDYILLMVTYHPELVTETVLDEFCALWKLFNDPGPLTRLLSQRNIMLLVQGCLTNHNGWSKFGRLVVHTLTNNLISIDDLELQVVAFFRYNWPENVLQSMSNCLREILNDVCQRSSRVNDPKIMLMLEMCSEMASYIHDDLDEMY